MDKENLLKTFREDTEKASAPDPVLEKRIEEGVHTFLHSKKSIQKLEEEKLYSQQGKRGIKNYLCELEMLNKAAKDEFDFTFDDGTTLYERHKMLDCFRNARNFSSKVQPVPKEYWPGDNVLSPALSEKPLYIKDANKDFNIEKYFKSSRGDHAKQADQPKKSRNSALHKYEKDVALSNSFSFPPTKKYAEKADKVLSKSIVGSNISYYMHKIDKKISDFLLDLGSAEYIITADNIISKTARKIMKVRLPNEAGMDLVTCPDGKKRTRWSYMVDKMENPKKYNED